MAVNNQIEQEKKPFAEDYWKEDGGDAWVEDIEKLEANLNPLSKEFMHRLNVNEMARILDIGCGGGITSIELANLVGAGGHVTGVDISPQILNIAKQRGKDISNLEFKLADAGTHDLGELIFDLIISRFGVMFFSEPIKAFNNIRRYMKEDGQFIFMCWKTFEENPWMAEPTVAIMESFPPAIIPDEKPDPEAPGPFSLGKKERINFVLSNAGFNSISIDSLEMEISMGNMTDAVDTLTKIGPAAKVIKNLEDEEKGRAVEILKKVLSKYETGESVIAPAACWIVTASL